MIELSRPNGSSAGRTLYSSIMPAAASVETRRALTQVAASLNADVVIDWLGSERPRGWAAPSPPPVRVKELGSEPGHGPSLRTVRAWQTPPASGR